ncbi:MAG: tetratricopeptide repeat protein, partial [Anaerolineae bacterium]
QPEGADWPAIVHICQLVDGLPLGIELAATAVRRHAPADIADRLSENLDFLAHSARNIPPRHRSLRAVFDYSWQLLEEGERTAVAQLAIFRSPISREAALQVCQTEPDVLAALVDKSLLTLAGNNRFNMHALVRQFAAEALAAQPELAQSVREQHGRYYAQLLQAQTPHFHHHQEERAITAIAAELEDIRAAWVWALRQHQWELISQSLFSLHWFFWTINRTHEGTAMITQAVEAAQAANAPALLIARLAFRRGALLSWLSKFDEALEILKEAITQLRHHQADDELGWALLALADIGYFQCDFEMSEMLYQEALTIFRQRENQAGIAYALNNLGNVVCDSEANYAAGGKLYEESLLIYRDLGNLRGQAKCLINLGANAQMQSDYESARQLYLEGITICREVGNSYALAVALNNLGQLEADQGNYDVGQRHLLESLDIKREIGERRSIAYALKHLGVIASRTGHHQQARGYFDEALIIGQVLASSSLLVDVLVSVAEFWLLRERAERAAVLLTAVRQHAAHDQVVMNQTAEMWAEITKVLSPTSRQAAESEGKIISLETAVIQALTDLRSG